MSWAEAYELALQLQEVQATTGDVRLSERNCVELVSYLTSKNLIDLIFTLDGREYITPKQLYIEVEQEIEFAKGRIGLIDLCDTLNVSVENVEPVVKRIIGESSTVFMVNSEIIHETYIEHIAMETNLKLQESGILKFSEICNKFDFPVSFVMEHLDKYLGKIIDGFYTPDKMSLMTASHQASQIGKVKGALLGTTKPMSLKTLSNVIKIADPILITIVNDLIANSEISGSLDRESGINSVFTPNIFLQHQIDSLQQSLDSTGMITFAQLSKLAVAEPKGFIEKNYTGNLTFLDDCCISDKVVSEPIAALEQCICDKTWLDLGSVLPTNLSVKNVLEIYAKCLESNPNFKTELTLLSDTTVVTNNFVLELEKHFHKQVQDKAVKDVQENYLMVEKVIKATPEGSTQTAGGNSKKEERKQKAMGKKAGTSKGMSVGGRGGREAKTKKAVKNKFRDRHDDIEISDSDQETGDNKLPSDKLLTEALKFSDIEDYLCKKFEDDVPSDSFCSSLAEIIFDPLRKLYADTLKTEFEKNQETKLSVTDMQNSLKDFAMGLPFLEKAVSEFSETQQFAQIEQYVLKNECNTAVNTLVNIILDEYGCSVSKLSELTVDKRLKLLNNIGNEKQKISLISLCKKFENVTQFSEAFHACCEMCDVYLGKVDKKKEKQLLSESIRKAEFEIQNAENLQDILLKSCLFLFQKTFKAPINLPGKFVSSFLEILKDKIDGNLAETLTEALTSVMSEIKSKAATEEKSKNNENSAAKNQELLEQLKSQVCSIPPSNQ